MSQNDFEIANQGFPAFRADLNEALQALATLSSGATAPIVPYNYQLWYDTSADILRIRNAANDAWIDVFTFDQASGEVFFPALNVSYDNAASGLIADTVQEAIDELKSTVDGFAVKGIFYKDSTRQPAWTKTGASTAVTSTDLFIEVEGAVQSIASGTTITMPTLSVGVDYAIWCTPAGALQASSNFTSPPVANSRLVGGFHFAPGGNAPISATGDWTTHNGGDTNPQINEYSFHDLKWRPSAPDPRGLTLVNDSFWAGMYLMSNGDGAGPLHRYNVNPCRDGNAPFKPYATTPTRYTNAIPINIFEVLAYNGFRAPDVNEFQLLAIGVNEARSIGGTGPGNTGIVADRNKNQQTSAWGVFDATGVLEVWGRDSLPSNVQDNNVTQGRSNNRWRISGFVRLGGHWNIGAVSGSRCVVTDPASNSFLSTGGRGVCQHLILP